jgi:two-component system response regulator YesN
MMRATVHLNGGETRQNALQLKRILIVDDEAKVAFFLREGLLGLGPEYEVQTSESAEQALERIRTQPVDLAVVDYCLPGADGLELLRQLNEICPDTRTLLITAYGSPEVQDQAYHLCACQYLAKPFHIEDLMCTVQQVLA